MGDGRIGNTPKAETPSGGERTGGTRRRRYTWFGNHTVQRADTVQSPPTNNTRSPHAIPQLPGASLDERLRVNSSAKTSHGVEGPAGRRKSTAEERKASSETTSIKAPQKEDIHKMAREILSLRRAAETENELSVLYEKCGKEFSARFFDSLPGYLLKLGNQDTKEITTALKRVFFEHADQPVGERDKNKRFNNYMLFSLIKISTFNALLSTLDIDQASAVLKSMMMSALSNRELDEYIEYKCEISANEKHHDPYGAWKDRNKCKESREVQWDSICKFLDDLVYCKLAVFHGGDNSLSEQVLSLLLLLGFLKKQD